ncbi:MAG TPA: hypothetical protein VM243_11415, partial [Phycisphaerae bacterium]|nr:hypothetical protein [Phycisphaerae bacterium]
PGDQALLVAVVVCDHLGEPVRGAQVGVESFSGPCYGVTDENGHTRIDLGEHEVIAVYVDQRRVASWENVLTEFLAPSCVAGLRMKITMGPDWMAGNPTGSGKAPG